MIGKGLIGLDFPSPSLGAEMGLGSSNWPIRRKCFRPGLVDWLPVVSPNAFMLRALTVAFAYRE